jgi:hypothetical protein
MAQTSCNVGATGPDNKIEYGKTRFLNRFKKSPRGNAMWPDAICWNQSKGFYDIKMAIEVHTEPLQRRYYAPVCSTTCCYMIIYGFVIILLPLIIAYNSYGKQQFLIFAFIDTTFTTLPKTFG